MGKIRNLCMTQLVRMKKIKEPDMYTWIFSSVDNCYYNYNSRYLFEYVKAVSYTHLAWQWSYTV